MATYAVLGSTTNYSTGLVWNLLYSLSAKFYTYCCNKTKLIRLLPKVASSEQLEIFKGSIHDITLLTSCARDYRAIFLVTSTNSDVPGYRVGQDTAIAVIRALENLKAECIQSARMPKLALLSSATIDNLSEE